VWAADVAGHVACYALGGRKLFDVAASPAVAVPDARLPLGSPLPAVVRCDGKGTAWVLLTLGRKVLVLNEKGEARGEAKAVPEAAGALHRAAATPAEPLIIGEKTLWRP
jgi:hypothetical protein